MKCLLSTVHTVAGCEWLKSVVKFKSIFWLKVSLFSSENATFFHSFYLYFYQELSNPVLFAPCACYSTKLKISSFNLTVKFSTLLNSRHRVKKALDLTIPGKNRDKMSGKKWHFQIQKMIVFFRKLTQTWQLTSTTHSLPQCALCSINISHGMVTMLFFHG